MKKITHENETVERWVNEAIKVAYDQLGTGAEFVSPAVIQGLASTHLLGIFAAQEENSRGHAGLLFYKFKSASLALVQAF